MDEKGLRNGSIENYSASGANTPTMKTVPLRAPEAAVAAVAAVDTEAETTPLSPEEERARIGGQETFAPTPPAVEE